MARRRRLDPPRPGAFAGEPARTEPAGAGIFPLGAPRQAPPISHVAGEAAASAALEDLSEALRSAREEGRLVQAVDLDAVEADHLIRDRMAAEAGEFEALTASLRARGQQTPVELVALGPGRYGLISGWRRLTALRRLHEETGDPRFAKVLALLRRPQDAPAAYQAMVEENEIRVGLSYYERARIVARTVDAGVFRDEAAALRGLFGAASRAKRSKIASFAALHRALDGALRFPAAIPERLGLRLARALEEDPGLGPRLRERLRKTPPADAEAELAALARACGQKPPAPAAPAAAVPPAPAPGPAPRRIALEPSPDPARPGLLLTGPGVDAGFRRRLEAWLAALPQAE